ncbi:MAG: site-specific integrase, partial [Desulfobacterales bacterium]
MRIKAKNYTGVYFRESKRIGGEGTEKVYYIVFKKDGKTHEEKVGRQYANKMTPAKANIIRSARIEGRQLSRKEQRELEKAEKDAENHKQTIDKLWSAYQEN